MLRKRNVTDGRTEGRKDGRTDGRKRGRTDIQPLFLYPPATLWRGIIIEIRLAVFHLLQKTFFSRWPPQSAILDPATPKINRVLPFQVVHV